MAFRSKYHYTFFRKTKEDKHLKNVRPRLHQWDTNHVDCSLKHIAFPWNEPGGNGSVVVVDFNQELFFSEDNRECDNKVIIPAHSRRVTDVKFNPFHPGILATAADDTVVRVWKIPEDGCRGQHYDGTDFLSELSGHTKRVGNIGWHPNCENVLVSCSVDRKLKIWDVERGSCRLEMSFDPGIPLHFDFNNEGNMMVLVDRKKRLYLIDPRIRKIVEEVHGVFMSMKGLRCVYMKDKDLCVCGGFDRGATRTLKLFDVKNMKKGPIVKKELDMNAGINMLFYDEDLSVLYVGAKGEGSIRFIDTVGRSLHQMNRYQDNIPQRGLCMLHKFGLSTKDHEIGRFYKLTNNTIVPLQVFFPRKSRLFQPDLFPDTKGFKPSGTSEDFFSCELRHLYPLERITLEPGKRDLDPFYGRDKYVRFVKMTKAEKEEDERMDSIIELFGDFKLPLAEGSKELNLWKCFLINSKEIFPKHSDSEEYRGLHDLNIDVDEKSILNILLGKHHLVSIEKDSLLDYFLFFRSLGMKREMKCVVDLLVRARKYSNFTDFYQILKRLAKEKYECELVQSWFQTSPDTHHEHEKIKIGIDTFKTSFGLALFNQLKDLYSSEIEKSLGDWELLEGFDILQMHLKESDEVVNLLDHSDFESDEMNQESGPRKESFPELYELCKNDKKQFDSTSNVTLVSTEGKGFPTHKEILVYRFEYFHSMFRSQWAEREALEKERKVEILDMDNKMLETFLEFMYTNAVEECDDYVVLIKLVAIGHKYMSPKLMNCCLERMDNMIVKIEDKKEVMLMLYQLIDMEVGEMFFNNEELLNTHFIPRFVRWSFTYEGRLEEVFRLKVRESQEKREMIKRMKILEKERNEMEQRVKFLEENIKLMEMKSL